MTLDELSGNPLGVYAARDGKHLAVATVDSVLVYTIQANNEDHSVVGARLKYTLPASEPQLILFSPKATYIAVNNLITKADSKNLKVYSLADGKLLGGWLL